MQTITTVFLYFFLQAMVIAAPVEDFTAKYKVYRNELYVGQSTRTLSSKNNHLEFSSVTKTAGIAAWFVNIAINETSKLNLNDNNLSFVSYYYNEKKKDKNKTYQLTLDEKYQQLYNSYTKQTYPVTGNVHDILGFTIAIMHDLAKGKRELNYLIAEKKHIKPYHLKFIKKEKLATNSGDINTLKMEHFDPIRKQRFTLWCAEKLNFLPVKISKVKENGDEILLNLTQINQKKIVLSLDNEENEEID